MDGDDEPRERPRSPKPRSSGRDDAGSWARDLGIAGLAVAIVIGSIFAYSSTWPPMVVIESGSMMHAPDRSMLGVIDTGDLTLVKKVDTREDVITYLEGQKSGFQTYGSYGNVIIYARNGHTELTPIIHRAIAWLEHVNSTGTPIAPGAPASLINSTWRIPALSPDDIVVHANIADRKIVDLGELRTWNTGLERRVNITIDLTAAALVMGAFPHSGFITKGDNNAGPDEAANNADGQRSLQGPAPDFDPHGSTDVQPVMMQWVVGRAEGELPWFGVLKLVAGGPNHGPIPANSGWNLLFAILTIAFGPFVVEKTWERYGEKVTSRIPQSARDKWHGAWDKLPGGRRRAERRREEAEERAAERERRGGRRKGGRAR